MRYYLNILILLIFIVFLNCSCQRDGSEKQNNPAIDLYCKYAESTNLTVAYLSDFKIHGNKINTVMIQAEEENEWEWLLSEFAVSKQTMMGLTGDTMSDPSYAVEVGMKWDTPFVSGDDIFTKEHLSDEEIELFAQAIINEFSTALNSLLETDNQFHNASIIINEDINMMSDMNFGMEFNDTTAVKRILQTVSEKLNNNGLAYNDTILSAETSFAPIDQNSSLMPDGQLQGDEGYIAAVDNMNHTIWVFFYKNIEESIHIMKHIRKDILVLQKY